MNYGNRTPRPYPDVEPLIATVPAAEALVAEVETAIDDLEAVIEEETRLVRTGQLFAAGQLEAEKSRVTAVYLRLRARVKTNGLAIGRLAAADVDRLRSRHDRFSAVLRDNLAVLAIAREVSEDLVRTVSDVAGRKTAPRVYGRDAGTGPDRLGGVRGIAIDRRL